jgi:hypothetical protein
MDVAALNLTSSIISGVNIGGLFSQYGFIYSFAGVPAGDTGIRNNHVRAMRVANSGGVAAWGIPTTGWSMWLDNCNVAQVNTYLQTQGGRALSAISYSGGTVTGTTVGNHGLTATLRAEVGGVKVAGSLVNNYNGQILLVTASTNTFTYVVASDPGTADANTGGVTGVGSTSTGNAILSASWSSAGGGTATIVVRGSPGFQFYSGMSVNVAGVLVARGGASASASGAFWP